jgi:hypothetical protein
MSRLNALDAVSSNSRTSVSLVIIPFLMGLKTGLQAAAFNLTQPPGNHPISNGF